MYVAPEAGSAVRFVISPGHFGPSFITFGSDEAGMIVISAVPPQPLFSNIKLYNPAAAAVNMTVAVPFEEEPIVVPVVLLDGLKTQFPEPPDA